ncbi:hypothetical protein B7G54_15355 [Burkholderia puraquae]|uniref:Uncharacterized protein n=1 Tax=Burkholderia puraquae TaxID=1904757 RepID=A0A1X1PHY0_9BURK|nr:hypothetical protein B7G54_15355 [Burkholderia puraquae]
MIHSVPIKRKRRARRLRSTPCKSVKKRLILAEKAFAGRYFRRRAARWPAGGIRRGKPRAKRHPPAAGQARRRAASASRTRASSNRWRHTSAPSSNSTGTSSS